MNKFTAESLNFLAEKWGYILEGAAGADLIGVNRATMRTRIAKGQAMAMRDTEGRERGRVEYTPHHLVYNMLYDGLARFNATPDDEETKKWIFMTVEGFYRDLSSGTFNQETVVRSIKRDGKVSLQLFHNFTEVEQYTGEPCVVVPIGTMIVRLASAMFMKHSIMAASMAMNAD